MSGKFVLIASYPKSGNTWTRIVLERLRRGADFPLNSLDGAFHGIQRRLLFDRIFPINAADLWAEEVDDMLPDMYREVAASLADPAFVKVHDNVRRTRSGRWLYPPECVSAAIYLTRHPFDVAVSNAAHFGISVETAIEFLAEDVIPGAPTTLREPLDQYFGTWSQNVSSWIDDAPYPLTVARYEDLLAEPVPRFLQLAGVAGMSVTAEHVAGVVDASRFERLQNEEMERGFCERPATSSRFFRAGRRRSWEGLLDEVSRDRLIRDHGAVMKRLGYRPDGDADPWNWEGGLRQAHPPMGSA